MAKRTKKVEKLKKKLSPKAKLVVAGIVFAAVCVVISLIGVALIYAGNGPVPIGSRNESGARSYLEDQLTDWRGDDGTDLFEGTFQPILVSYEIVNVREAPGDTLTYAFVVQLEFTTRAGGRPIEQHTFRVRWSDSEGEWKVVDESRYYSRG